MITRYYAGPAENWDFFDYDDETGMTTTHRNGHAQAPYHVAPSQMKAWLEMALRGGACHPDHDLAVDIGL